MYLIFPLHALWPDVHKALLSSLADKEWPGQGILDLDLMFYFTVKDLRGHGAAYLGVEGWRGSSTQSTCLVCKALGLIEPYITRQTQNKTKSLLSNKSRTSRKWIFLIAAYQISIFRGLKQQP